METITYNIISKPYNIYLTDVDDFGLSYYKSIFEHLSFNKSKFL